MSDLITRLRSCDMMDDTVIGDEAADALDAKDTELERLTANEKAMLKTIDNIQCIRMADEARIAELETAIDDVYHCWLRDPDIFRWGGAFPRLFKALKGDDDD